MARTKTEVLIVQSLIDRLTDFEDWPNTRNSTLAMYREGIKRDVEWLLNSRRPFIESLDSYKEASSSVLNYGLPDLSQFSGTEDAPTALALSIAQTLRTFEPRIRDPHVSVTRSDTVARNVRFHVDGQLVFENADEDISFDTLLEMTSGEYAVKKKPRDLCAKNF